MVKPMVRRLPQGQSDFPRIREDGRIYVEKTDLVWELVHDQDYAFLSRPRRFGKSLLISTLEAYFQGRRELFEGLAINDLESEWTSYPVLRLDMSVGASSYLSLRDQLSVQLSDWEHDYVPTDVDAGQSLGTRFRSVVRGAYKTTGQRVVVLVDEYDAPLQHSVLDEEEHEAIRTLYRDFFAVLKSEAGSIRFCFLTGIAKFTQLSIFSVLSNLTNISFLPRYQAICGITERELASTFGPEIEGLAQALGTDAEGALSQLRDMYDGYLFCEGGERLYNPYSVVNALANKSIDPYWYSSGQSSILSRMLGEVWHELPELEGSRISMGDLKTSDFSLYDPQVLLYQLGYLTIDHADRETGEYVLRFPNAEVRDALYKERERKCRARNSTGEGNMRLWMGDGGLMTDEQVLAYVGHFGSLSEALSHGDIRLVADGDSRVGALVDGDRLERESSTHDAEGAGIARPSLADYLHENDLRQRETPHE